MVAEPEKMQQNKPHGHSHAALIQKTKATDNKQSIRCVLTAKTDSLNKHHWHGT